MAPGQCGGRAWTDAAVKRRQSSAADDLGEFRDGRFLVGESSKTSLRLGPQRCLRFDTIVFLKSLPG